MKKFTFFIFIFILGIGNIQASNRTKVILKQCVDGDTAKFIVHNKIETVRFLAIDTPEVKHPTKGREPFGKIASHYTCDVLKKANTIELEFEDGNKTDKYNRLLAWVFVDNTLLQDDLIKKGYAKVAYLYDDYRYNNLLKVHETEAKLKEVGIWNNQNMKRMTIFQIMVSVICVLIVIILFITNQKYRRQSLRKIKRKIKKKISL